MPKEKRKHKPRPGRRYPLLMYRRTMDRLRGITFILGLVLLALWRYGEAFTGFYRAGWVENFVLAGAVLGLGIGVFAFIARYLCYAQPKSDHLLIATPFIRLKTSYRRIIEVRSIDFHHLVPAENLSWSQRAYLEPFFGDTSVVVKLRGYPLPPVILMLFFPKYMLTQNSPGFVLMVPDWMKLSLELDSRYSAWQQQFSPKARVPGFQRGLYR